MSEYDHEPVRGLPGELPDGERVIWQGAPDWRRLAASALHVRLAAAYFAVIGVVALLREDLSTAAAMLALGAIVIVFLTLFAWGVSRTTVYTLTNRRIVLRIGVALNKCINIPLTEIETADLKILPHETGSIVLSLKGKPKLGYLMLWPHVRSLRLVRPRPTLRAIPDAVHVSGLLFAAVQRVQPAARKPFSAGTIPARQIEGLPA